ncbi:MAG: carbohydrate ABC transporter permease [Anaerolineae bacterium]|nr:carbohydrate ABC transporter permease [Anaerolineae bacterium]MDW8173724.1 carbohydrate ABC transporter permease [Anaerolineae bacterium]
MNLKKSPLTVAIIHGLLLVWVVYSVLPFVMSIIASLQITRDATARVPRYMPSVLVDNNLLIAAFLAGLILLAFVFIRRSDPEPTNIGHVLVLLAVMGLVVGGFLLATSTVPANQTFQITWNNYQVLWLSGTQDLTPVVFGLGLLGLVLTAAAIGATRLGVSSGMVYLGIAAIIFMTIVFLPNFVRFAEFYDFFLNSVIVTVGTVVISISIGCLAGYGLARYSGFASVVLLFGALAFRALPRLAFILPYYYFAQLSGLYDTYFLLIVTFVAINQPFTIWMLRSFFMDIPRELEEAAMIDGCNRLTAFFRVILPITWPGIVTTSLFTLLLAYNEFLLARILTSTLWTLPVGISRFTSGEDVRLLPLSNASAVSITIPIIFIIIFFQRHLIKGLAGGAIKG